MILFAFAQLFSAATSSWTIAHSDVPLISVSPCLRLEGKVRVRPKGQEMINVLLFGTTLDNQAPQCVSSHITGFRIGVLQNKDAHFGSGSWSPWQDWDMTLEKGGRVDMPMKSMLIDRRHRGAAPATFAVELRTVDADGNVGDAFTDSASFSLP
jgi:hypothetical protein